MERMQLVYYSVWQIIYLLLIILGCIKMDPKTYLVEVADDIDKKYISEVKDDGGEIGGSRDYGVEGESMWTEKKLTTTVTKTTTISTTNNSTSAAENGKAPGVIPNRTKKQKNATTTSPKSPGFLHHDKKVDKKAQINTCISAYLNVDNDEPLNKPKRGGLFTFCPSKSYLEFKAKISGKKNTNKWSEKKKVDEIPEKCKKCDGKPGKNDYDKMEECPDMLCLLDANFKIKELGDIYNSNPSFDNLHKELQDSSHPWTKFKRDGVIAMNQDFHKSVDQLTKIITSIDDIDEYFTFASHLLDTPSVNQFIVKWVLQGACMSREDHANDVISPLETYSQVFLNPHDPSKYGSNAARVLLHNTDPSKSEPGAGGAETGAGGEDNCGSDYDVSFVQQNVNIPDKLTVLPDGDPENKINYWREDPLLHLIHWGFHSLTGRVSKVNTDNRKREYFVYFHRQVLNRYVQERKAVGLPAITPLTTEDQKRNLPGSYDPSAWVLNKKGTRFMKRIPNCLMSPNSLQQLAQDAQRLTGMISRQNGQGQADNEGFFGELENNYHNHGHVAIDRCTQNGTGGCVIAMFEASARDPIFWRWHTEVDRMALLWSQKLKRYTVQDLNDLRDNLALGEVSITGTTGKNMLSTKMTKGLVEHKNAFKLMYTRIDHEPFSFSIKINNPRGVSRKVIIRVFLGEHTGSNNMVDMDRFVHSLSGQTNEQITRSSADNTLTMKDSGLSLDEFTNMIKGNSQVRSTWCGLPHHMYVPRGTAAGTKYRLIAHMNEVDQKCNEGEDGMEFILCGHRDQRFRFDKRTFGFPYDRPWADGVPQRMRSKAEASITIIHTG